MVKKIKSLHCITISNCTIQTRLQYNLNTDHIGIGTYYFYNNPEKVKKPKNKFCIICNKLLINKQRKYCDKCKDKTHLKQMNDNYKDNKDEYLKSDGKYIRDNQRCLGRVSGEDHWNFGKSVIEETRIKLSCSHRGIPIEDFDGFSKEKPYCPKFNESCRESNREKYNRECFICNKSEEQNGKKLSVHHVDMNKNQGCDSEWKLVPLCQSCHSKSHNKLWEYRLKYLLKI